MTEGWDEIEAAVYAVVLDVLAVEATLVPEVLLKLLVDVVSHWLPARAERHGDIQSPRQRRTAAHHFLNTAEVKWGHRAVHRLFYLLNMFDMYHSVLFTASPNPGVSTMVSFSLTPFSSISTVCLVISTVCVIRSKDTNTPLLLISAMKYCRTNINRAKTEKKKSSPSALSSFLSL